MRAGPGAFWRRRAGRIVPALVVWSAFSLLVAHWGISGAPLSLHDLGIALLTGRTYTHLYVLWAIAGLYLLAPLLAAAIAPDEGRRAWVPGTAGVLWMIAVMAIPRLTDGAYTPVSLVTLTFGLVYAGYFVLGRAVLALPPSRRIAAALAPSCVSPTVALASVALFAGVVGLWRTWEVGPRAERMPRWLGEASFGVYLGHVAVVVALRAGSAWFRDTTSPAVIAATWVLALLVALGATLVLQRVPGLRRIV